MAPLDLSRGVFAWLEWSVVCQRDTVAVYGTAHNAWIWATGTDLTSHNSLTNPSTGLSLLTLTI